MKTIWLLFDVTNGDGLTLKDPALDDPRHYVWWFHTRRAALAKLRLHQKIVGRARLVGPFKALVPTFPRRAVP